MNNAPAELLPCPFCGGKGQIEEIEIYEDSGYVIRCTECESDGSPCYYENKAIEHWNRRTQS